MDENCFEIKEEKLDLEDLILPSHNTFLIEPNIDKEIPKNDKEIPNNDTNKEIPNNDREIANNGKEIAKKEKEKQFEKSTVSIEVKKTPSLYNHPVSD